MSLELTGKLIQILPELSGEGKNGPWNKISFVLETQDQYPKKVCFDAWKDRVDTVKNLKIGDTIRVGFDIESREFNGKWYTNAKTWKIETVSAAEAPGGADEPLPDVKDVELPSEEGNDDLPF
jgi:hypothetical protein